MTAVDLRERFGARLLAARRVATRKSDLTVPVRPDEVRLRSDDAPPYQLLGSDLAEARAAISAVAPQARVCVINLGHRHTPSGLRFSRVADAPLAAAGLDVRSVYDKDGIWPEARAMWTEAERAQIREGYVMERLIVFDRIAVVMDGPPLVAGAHLSTWLVTDPEIVALATGLWEASWRLAQPVAPPPEPEPAELTPRQRAMIPLLLEGRSEAMIARDFGIAPRTVTYDVKSLMRTLGATCRVDLGYRIRLAEEAVSAHAG